MGEMRVINPSQCIPSMGELELPTHLNASRPWGKWEFEPSQCIRRVLSYQPISMHPVHGGIRVTNPSQCIPSMGEMRVRAISMHPSGTELPTHLNASRPWGEMRVTSPFQCISSMGEMRVTNPSQCIPSMGGNESYQPISVHPVHGGNESCEPSQCIRQVLSYQPI